MKEDDSSYLGTRYKLSGKKGERKCRHLSYCNWTWTVQRP